MFYGQMFEKEFFIKYKKLILSQLAAVFGVASLVLGWLRYQETQSWGEQMAGSFLFFAVLLFAAEIKLLIDWMRQRKATKAI